MMKYNYVQLTSPVIVYMCMWTTCWWAQLAQIGSGNSPERFGAILLSDQQRYLVNFQKGCTLYKESNRQIGIDHWAGLGRGLFDGSGLGKFDFGSIIFSLN